MKAIYLLVLLFMLAGCATVSGIRSLAPEKTLNSPLSPNEASNCVLYRAPEEVGSIMTAYYNFSRTESPKGTYQILIQAGSTPTGEVVFKPNGNGGSIISLKAAWNFWEKEALWSCIQHCASPRKTAPAQ